MADTVTNKVIWAGKRKYVVKLTSLSDGTGEAAVTKIIRANLIGPSGTIPRLIVIDQVEYDVGGMNVLLFWDHTVPDVICTMGGAGFLDWTPQGGLMDPLSAGGTGNITLTSLNPTLSDTYTITLYMRLKD